MAGSGKTTWANFLSNNFDYQRERFARTVYDGVSKIFEVSEAEILSEKSFWRPVMQGFGTHVVRNPAAKGMGPSEIVNVLTQSMPWDRRQKFNRPRTWKNAKAYLSSHPYGEPDAFIKLTRKRIEDNFAPDTPIAMDDCRFVNEAHALVELGFVIVQLACDETAALERMRARDGHADAKSFDDPSEQEWKLITPHYVIDVTQDKLTVASTLLAILQDARAR